MQTDKGLVASHVATVIVKMQNHVSMLKYMANENVQEHYLSFYIFTCGVAGAA